MRYDKLCLGKELNSVLLAVVVEVLVALFGAARPYVYIVSTDAYWK